VWYNDTSAERQRRGKEREREREREREMDGWVPISPSRICPLNFFPLGPTS
jgi:hypothetical protein